MKNGARRRLEFTFGMKFGHTYGKILGKKFKLLGDPPKQK